MKTENTHQQKNIIFLSNSVPEPRMLKLLTVIERAYLAGFLDGDGCLNAQIVRRVDYRLKFQILITIHLVN